MRKCELCEGAARMYCESDQASLCWDCDEKVHRANFLVAKHLRCLLCHVCQSVTPWKASGQKLAPTVSVCETCVSSARFKVDDDDLIVKRDNQCERSNCVDEDDDLDDNEEDDEYDEESDDDGEDEDEEDGENQVVPWSVDSQSLPPPVSCSSSNSSSSEEEEVSLKRIRSFSDLCSDEEIGCSYSHIGSRAATNEEASSSLIPIRPLKQQRTTTTTEPENGQSDSRSTAIVSSLRRLQKQLITKDGDAAAAISGICRLSRDHSR